VLLYMTVIQFKAMQFGVQCDVMAGSIAQILVGPVDLRAIMTAKVHIQLLLVRDVAPAGERGPEGNHALTMEFRQEGLLSALSTRDAPG
jgi:hypothetical protein